METDRRKMILTVLPKLPLAARVALLHALHVSQQSKYLDLRTELTVALIRSFVTDPARTTVTQTQKLFLRDPGIKGRIWIAKYTAPAPPESDVRDALLEAINGLAVDPRLVGETIEPPKSAAAAPAPAPAPAIALDMVAVEAEWTGYRAGASRQAALPPISEAEKYFQMMKDCKSPVTVLYLHGGAYWLMDPATHRASTKKLAKLTKGRCYSVRYRLAPQSPFPAALLDALVSYLTLLYPPPGAFHDPVRPANIVFAGDSAGGNLSFALIQTVLELRRQKRKVMWLGEERELPLPAGVAVCSPWMDVTTSSPSWEENGKWDYLPTPSGHDFTKRPQCEAWPAQPPRQNMYVDDSLLLHPLVSPVAVPSQCWEGCPPVFMCTGWELLADENKYMAARLAAAGVPVVFEEYEAMPHCFAMIFTHLAGSQRCLQSWSGFISKVADVVVDENGVAPTPSVKSSFTTIKAKTLKEVQIAPDAVTSCSEEDMEARLQERIMRSLGAELASAKL